LPQEYQAPGRLGVSLASHCGSIERERSGVSKLCFGSIEHVALGSKELKKEKFLCREAILPPVIRVILPRCVSERYSRLQSERYSCELPREAILLFLLSVAVMTFYGDDVYQHYGVIDSVYYPIFFVNPSGVASWGR